MQLARGFGQFWWDFIVGDDPTLAIGVVLVLAIARLLEQNGAEIAAWLIGPIGVFVILAISLARAIRPAVEAQVMSSRRTHA